MFKYQRVVDIAAFVGIWGSFFLGIIAKEWFGSIVAGSLIIGIGITLFAGAWLLYNLLER